MKKVIAKTVSAMLVKLARKSAVTTYSALYLHSPDMPAELLEKKN